MSAPLERLYPNRCFDCLAVVPHGDLLCTKCEAMYAPAPSEVAGGES